MFYFKPKGLTNIWLESCCMIHFALFSFQGTTLYIKCFPWSDLIIISHRFQSVKHFLTGSFLSSQPVSRQVLSASECLTTVFGMGTGGSIQASPPDIQLKDCSFKTIQKKSLMPLHFRSLHKSSPRLISTGPLHSLLNFHSLPIHLVFFKESY